MRTAEYDGDQFLLVKSSTDSSLLRNPDTGEEQYVPNADLTVTGETPLEFAARTVSKPQRRLLTAIHSETVLGLLVELDRQGPLSVREILSRYDLCESDLHGRIAELRAAELVREAEVDGEPGYATTDLATEALATLR